MQDSERDIPRRSTFTSDNEQGIDEYHEQTPRNSPVSAIGIGIAGGIINIVFPLVVTIANASTYRAVAQLQDKATVTQAWTVTGLWCLDSFVNILVCVLAGFLVGKVTRQRQFAPYAGAIVGFMTYLVPAFLEYIPNFPGHVVSGNPTPAATSAGTLVMIITTIVYIVVGALLALFGSYLATQKNRYYIAKRHF